MRRIFRILRNQAIDSADQGLIERLRKEAQSEKDADLDAIDPPSEIWLRSAADFSDYSDRSKAVPRPKWIFSLGFACLILAFFSIYPPAKLRLLIPSEREQVDRQVQAMNELLELHAGLDASLLAIRENWNLESLLYLNSGSIREIPPIESILSLGGISKNFVELTPPENYGMPEASDFDFLFQKEWRLFKEKIIGLERKKSS